jgi:hypothetical protein
LIDPIKRYTGRARLESHTIMTAIHRSPMNGLYLITLPKIKFAPT